MLQVSAQEEDLHEEDFMERWGWAVIIAAVSCALLVSLAVLAICHCQQNGTGPFSTTTSSTTSPAASPDVEMGRL